MNRIVIKKLSNIIGKCDSYPYYDTPWGWSIENKINKVEIPYDKYRLDYQIPVFNSNYDRVINTTL